MTHLAEMIEELPPDLRREVEDFVEFLLEREVKPKRKGTPTFAWAGALKELRDQYTSVELQHEILKWWSEEE